MEKYIRTDVLLSARGVSKSYGNKLIIKDINFEIKDIIRPDVVQGQVVSLVGRSGCGKTTLLRVLAGLTSPTTGEVKMIGNKNINSGDIGMVFQNYYLYEWRTVGSILKLAAKKNKKITAAGRKDYINGVVSSFELSDHLAKYPAQLSGGQKQRVAITEQIVSGGEIILFDEPFSGLDTIMVDKVTEMLVKVSQSSELKTLVIISHDLSNSLAISDTVYILAKSGEGSTIIKEIDMIERDLVWQRDIKDNPKFRETLKEVRSLL